MPLGQGIAEMFVAVRDRIEVSGHEPTWQVTAGSFDAALGYARRRFGEPAVLDRNDRNRWWPRVTLTVTVDPVLARSAPRLEDVAQATKRLPSSLEAIFAHQEERRIARQRTPDHDTVADARDGEA